MISTVALLLFTAADTLDGHWISRRKPISTFICEMDHFPLLYFMKPYKKCAGFSINENTGRNA